MQHGTNLIQVPRSEKLFFYGESFGRNATSAYFVNGNTQVMSDLTDIQFYTSDERIWLCISFTKWACGRLTEDADFGNNKSLFQIKFILIMAGV